jgi:Na+/melibiose symporter-like transporter
VAQTSAARDGIRLTMSVFPAVGFALCAACLFFYTIDRSAEIRITTELKERRKLYTTPGREVASH